MAKNNGMYRKVTQDNFVTEKIDVIQNNLLGSYDDEGNYTIAPQIVEELIELDKVKKTTFGNSIFCVGNLLGYGELVFELLFDSKTHNGKSASATLYLLEDVDKINGYLQNTIKTKLEDFSEDVEDFIEETYDHFNIELEDDDDDDDEGRDRKITDESELEDSFILAKKQFSLLLDKLLSEKFLDEYGKYFTARISTLTKLDNGFCRAVLATFNKQYSMIENLFLQEKNYKMLNELLDKSIEEMSGTKPEFAAEEKAYDNAIKPSLDSFVHNVNKLNERYENKALNMLDKADREKVEEMLEEQEDEKTTDTYESKPSVEQIVNDVKKNTYTQRKQEAETAAPAQVEKTAKVAEAKESTQQASETSAPVQGEASGANFYSEFKKNHTVATPVSTGKVLDTSRSQEVDVHESSTEERAATSLKDRISRLERFKDTSAPVKSAEMGESGMGSVYETLYREKSKKTAQAQSKNRATREMMDNLTPEMLVPRDRYFGDSGMER